MAPVKKNQDAETRKQTDMLTPLERLLSGQAGPLPIDVSNDQGGSLPDGRESQGSAFKSQEETVVEDFYDPWLKMKREIDDFPVDSELKLICSYDLLVEIANADELTYYRRTSHADELWISTEYIGFGCALRVAHQDMGETDVCRELLGRLFRSRVGFGWPGKFYEAGILSETDFNMLREQIEKELDDNAEKSRQGEGADIIKVAEEMRLYPQPTGTGPSHWQARCPETNHVLYINSETNSFGCGYCRRKGGPEELRLFANQRKQMKR